MSSSKRTPPPVRESAVERKLCQLIAGLGGLALKFKSPERASVPDRIILLRHNTHCFVECKRPGEEATEAQAREHGRLRDLGHRVYVVDSLAGAVRLRGILARDLDRRRQLSQLGVTLG